VVMDAGIRVIRTPYPAPNGNAHAERFVRSNREEWLNRLIPFGERHEYRADDRRARPVELHPRGTLRGRKRNSCLRKSGTLRELGRQTASGAIGCPDPPGGRMPSHRAIVAPASASVTASGAGPIDPGTSERMASMSGTFSARNRYRVRLRRRRSFRRGPTRNMRVCSTSMNEPTGSSISGITSEVRGWEKRRRLLNGLSLSLSRTP
jgi:hypothetical protein